MLQTEWQNVKCFVILYLDVLNESFKVANVFKYRFTVSCE